jgi:release factor glutamine methyltransferase
MQIYHLQDFFKNSLVGYFPTSEVEEFFDRLSMHILNRDRLNRSLNRTHMISPSEFEHFENAIQRLKTYEPIQYIIGHTFFYGYKFVVNPSVLIPRPETEMLVDWIVHETSSSKSIKILDIGTGSGCIAISLAKAFPKARLVALDRSSAALGVAQSNAKQHQVEVNFIEADILDYDHSFEGVDLIVSNPPYVTHAEKTQMDSNVLDYEPHLALFVDDSTPLVFYRAILKFAYLNLKPSGLVYFEINEQFAQELADLCVEEGFQDVRLKKDLQHKQRMLCAQINKF